ncbi:response regulator [Mastigocoleus sp. MO_188.B34]|uniref:response regulator n=1 Tax=Mastigocoleus sp. MO_188.B34 TaxID=3036635 RepID=UPI00263737DD|nr:response regulator [Mastigocoleus sp. MO_188.B34]MDJ0697673.1 response regulator [Mastigocoleus sp. MO_188.B34]
MFNYSQTSEIFGRSNNLLHLKNLDRYTASDSKTDTIVIADEDPEVQDALSVAVRQWAQDEQRNVKTIIVSDGQQAVDYVQATDKNPPFLVILDLRMPKKNGLQSAKEINKLFPQIPIIMTASHDENDQQLIKQADDFDNQNSHIGFIIRTNSLPLLKVTLESEIKEVFSGKKRAQENSDLFNTFQGTLSQLLSKVSGTF